MASAVNQVIAAARSAMEAGTRARCDRAERDRMPVGVQLVVGRETRVQVVVEEPRQPGPALVLRVLLLGPPDRERPHEIVQPGTGPAQARPPGATGSVRPGSVGCAPVRPANEATAARAQVGARGQPDQPQQPGGIRASTARDDQEMHRLDARWTDRPAPERSTGSARRAAPRRRTRAEPYRRSLPPRGDHRQRQEKATAVPAPGRSTAAESEGNALLAQISDQQTPRPRPR